MEGEVESHTARRRGSVGGLLFWGTSAGDRTRSQSRLGKGLREDDNYYGGGTFKET